jgi:hypothetical protein
MDVKRVEAEIVKFGIGFKDRVEHPVKGKQKEDQVQHQRHIKLQQL